MRLVDTDKEIVKLETEIAQQQKRLEYWELRQRHDRNNADVYRRVRDGRDRIEEAKKKIEYLKSIPDAVLEGTVMDKEWNLTWIPADEPPETGDCVLLSFSNYSVPCVGTYRRDLGGGGAYYIGTSLTRCLRCGFSGLFVNAWMPLPQKYEEDER